MKKWFSIAIVNIFLALMLYGCLNFHVIVTPDRQEKRIEAKPEKTTVNYNNVPKIEFKNEGSKPVGQVQNFEAVNPETVPEINDLGPEK